MNRRNFFEEFAREKGFDPLVADNWYRLPRDQIVEVKVSIPSLSHSFFHLCTFCFFYLFSSREQRELFSITTTTFRRPCKTSFLRSDWNRNFGHVSTSPLHSLTIFSHSSLSSHLFLIFIISFLARCKCQASVFWELCKWEWVWSAASCKLVQAVIKEDLAWGIPSSFCFFSSFLSFFLYFLH